MVACDKSTEAWSMYIVSLMRVVRRAYSLNLQVKLSTISAYPGPQWAASGIASSGTPFYLHVEDTFHMGLLHDVCRCQQASVVQRISNKGAKKHWCTAGLEPLVGPRPDHDSSEDAVTQRQFILKSKSSRSGGSGRVYVLHGSRGTVTGSSGEFLSMPRKY